MASVGGKVLDEFSLRGAVLLSLIIIHASGIILLAFFHFVQHSGITGFRPALVGATAGVSKTISNGSERKKNAVMRFFGRSCVVSLLVLDFLFSTTVPGCLLVRFDALIIH